MNKQVLKSLTLVCITSISLSGCIIVIDDDGHGDSRGNVSSIMGGVSVSEGKQVSDISSVNGGIELADFVTAENVSSVNGGLEAGNNVTLSEISTVNGNVDIGHHFTSYGNVETVNGSITIENDSKVEGNIETVNGNISLNNVEVSSDLITQNGSIYLSNATVVRGNIMFKARKDRRDYGSSQPVLSIERGSIVEGEIILQRDIELQFEDAELLRKVRYDYDAR